MAFSLSDLLQAMYRELGQLNARKATGGSTTTVVDSNLIGGALADDAPNNGTMFVVRDAAGASAAPEGEFQRISDFVESTGTFTVDTAFTAAPASGDTYAWASNRYPLQNMIQHANDGLRALGDIILVDTTTLDTAASQTEYTWSVAWKRRPPLRIDVQGRTGDANDNRWEELENWYPVPASPGSTGLLILTVQPPVSRDVRIWYQDRHPLLYTYSDKVSETIDPELAVLAGLEKVLSWYVTRSQGQDPLMIQRWNSVKVDLERKKADVPVWKPKHSPRLFTIRPASVQDLPWNGTTIRL